MELVDKEQKLRHLKAEWAGCDKCGLSEKRTNMVFWEGNPNADIFILGIGPGEQEDMIGAPFQGVSGDILSQDLQAAGIYSDEVFICNIVACRPYDMGICPFKKVERAENRDPSKIERDACRPLWQEALYLVDPLIIVSLGKPVLSEILGKTNPPVSKFIGSIVDFKLPGRLTDVTYPTMVNWHPAYLARNGDTTLSGPWEESRRAWMRTAFYVDILRNAYHGTPIQDRGFPLTAMDIVQR
jgi:uracil-DNA glycosylase family 4